MISTEVILGSNANARQLEAIIATDGPVLIIAGPGSGKTFTLVERIIYLITQKLPFAVRCRPISRTEVQDICASGNHALLAIRW